MIKIILLVLALVAFASAVPCGRRNPNRPVPNDTPFKGFETKQCIVGVANISVVHPVYGYLGGLDLPSGPFGPASFAADPVNKRYMFDHATSYQWTYENGTYTYALNEQTFGMDCYYDASYTYDYEVGVHRDIIKIGRETGRDEYFGLSHDVGSCDEGIALSFLVAPRTGVTRQMVFSTGFPSLASDPPTGIIATGVINYDDSCPTSGPSWTAKYQLPPACLVPNLPEWCVVKKFT